MHKNVDVLLWSFNSVTRMVQTALQHKEDITLFDQNSTYNGFFPDIVLITAKDIIQALKDRLSALQRYPKAKIVYLRRNIDITVISIGMLVGFDGLINTSTTPNELYKMLQTLGEAPEFSLSQRKRSRFIIDEFTALNRSGLTMRQLAILCCLTRNLSYSETAKLLNTTCGDVFIAEGVISSRLHTIPSALRSPAMLVKYGAIDKGLPFKVYRIPKRILRPGRFLVPKFYD